MSKANRQTQSKDPVHAGTIGGAVRYSHMSTWTMSILLMFR